MSGIRRMGAFRALAISIVVGLVAGLCSAFFFVHSSHRSDTAPPGDRVRAAIAGLRKDHFYVGPELRDRLTPAQQQAISAAVDKGRAPTYLIYWTGTTSAGYYLDFDAIDQIMKGLGKDGHYAIVDDDLTATSESRGMSDPYVDQDLLRTRPAVGLLAYGKELARQPAEATDDSNDDYWGGPGGGFAAGVLFAGGGFLVLLLVVWFIGWLRPRRSPS